MRDISDIPYDETVVINKDSKVVSASSFGVGGVNDEIRIIVCDKKLVSDESGFKLINESNLQIIMNKETAIGLKNLLEKYTQ